MTETSAGKEYGGAKVEDGDGVACVVVLNRGGPRLTTTGRCAGAGVTPKPESVGAVLAIFNDS